MLVWIIVLHESSGFDCRCVRLLGSGIFAHLADTAVSVVVLCFGGHYFATQLPQSRSQFQLVSLSVPVFFGSLQFVSQGALRCTQQIRNFLFSSDSSQLHLQDFQCRVNSELHAGKVNRDC